MTLSNVGALAFVNTLLNAGCSVYKDESSDRIFVISCKNFKCGCQTVKRGDYISMSSSEGPLSILTTDTKGKVGGLKFVGRCQ